MSLFKKPNRKFRQRVTHSDSDNEEEKDAVLESSEKPSVTPSASTDASKKKASNVPIQRSDSPGAAAKRKTPLLPTPANSSTLSSPGTTSSVTSVIANTGNREKPKITFGFGNFDTSAGISADDADSGTLKQRMSKLLSFHDEEDADEEFKVKKSNYSRRLAKQLQRERKKRQLTNQKDDKGNNKNLGLMGQVTESSVGAPDSNEVEILNAEEAEAIDSETDESDRGGKGNNAAHPFSDVLKSGVIPDAATIYALKKQRQLARELGDAIPGDDIGPDGTRSIRDDDNAQSDVVDDDDDDDDEEEETGRISFTLHTPGMDRQKARAMLSAHNCNEAELEHEDAAEIERWEQEQIRKGVSIAQVPQQLQSESPYVQASNLPKLPAPPVLLSTKEETKATEKQVINAMKWDKEKLTVEMIQARLKDQITSLEGVHRAHKQELENVRQNLVASRAAIDKAEKDGPLLTEYFYMYQKMKSYIVDLSECLDAKLPHVMNLEDQLLELYKSRSDKLISRRQQDVLDQSEEYSSLSKKTLRGLGMDIHDSNTVEDGARLRRTAEREGRRMRRRQAREIKLIALEHREGMSSDDECSDMEIMHFNSKRDQILKEAETVFEDVVEDFGTMDSIKKHFEIWKSTRPETYREAYVSLCLPKIFAPFVRLELLHWNPLEDNPELEPMGWYEALAYYGYDNGTPMGDFTEDEDPDLQFIPRVVDKIVLPKISEYIVQVWDPMSARQSYHLVQLVKKLAWDYPEVNGKSKRLQELLEKVVSRIHKALDEDIFIPLYPPELLDNRNLGASSFFQRQFWSCVKLLKNILNWSGILAEAPLKELALDSLLNRYIVFALQNTLTQKDTIEKFKIIVSMLPSSWFRNLKMGTTIPHLERMCTCLKSLAQTSQTGPFKDGQSSKDLAREVAHLLLTVGATDHAKEIASQFGITALRNVNLGKLL